MSAAPADPQPPLASDPFELWRQIYEANERAWNAALERSMATPAFAEASGKLLETFLAGQKAVRDNMRAYLETINVPTREDIARLGELIVSFEEKIDQLDDRLGDVETAARRAASAAERAAGLEQRLGQLDERLAGLENTARREARAVERAVAAETSNNGTPSATPRRQPARRARAKS